MTAQDPKKSREQSSPVPRELSAIADWLFSLGINIKEPASALEILAGDGSQRTFYRLTTPQMTRILLSDPAWILSKDYAPHQEYLNKQGLPVPRFFEGDTGRGFLLMEDLGDELLQYRIQAQPATKISWLEESTRLLAQLHGKTFPVPTQLPVYTRKFDIKKYSEEFAFTFEHLVTRFLGLPAPKESELKEITSFCQRLEAMIPEVFCHRDYHCRNLVLHREKLYLIDFQDARLGPAQYDLASLVYDAYVPISETEREALVKVYEREVKQFDLGKKIDWANFSSGLKAVAFQRTIKAAGSFASFQTRFNKSTHLQYIAPALSYARSILAEKNILPASLRTIFPLDLWLEQLQKRGPK